MLRWTLGECSNPESYAEFSSYLQRCCLAPGQYTLICQNTVYPDGWYGGHIEIQGHKYCDDFLAYKTLRRIIIKGNIIIKSITRDHKTRSNSIYSSLFPNVCVVFLDIGETVSSGPDVDNEKTTGKMPI